MSANAWAAIAGQLIDWGQSAWSVDRTSDMQDHAMNMSAAEAATNRDFQERMRGSQYQTAVGDMKAAGLNPMLAYSQGGAGNLGGASGSGFAGTATAPRANMMENMATAAQIDKIHAETENIRADTMGKTVEPDVKRAVIDNLNAQAKKLGAEAQLTDSQTLQVNEIIKKVGHEIALLQSQKGKVDQEAMSTILERQLTRAQIRDVNVRRILNELDVNKAANEARAQESFYMREVAPYTGELGRLISSGAEARRAFRPDYTPRRHP